MSAQFSNRVVANFWAKAGVGDTGACWPWTASRGGSGYGHWWMTIDGTHRCVDAHRAAWILTHGPVPPGLHIAHRCNLKLCVNPRHLRIATPAENVRDAMRDGLFSGKLNASAALAIVKARRAGRMIVEIAGDRGLKAEHVRRVLAGRNWSAVTGISPPAPLPELNRGQLELFSPDGAIP